MLTYIYKGINMCIGMKKTNTLDSSASPFIVQKDVILCRSGIQIYSYNEVKMALGEPPVKKDFYREYRPASVVVKAQDLCHSLPVTKEHPDTWVTPDNWSSLAGGVLDKEVSVVALDGESDGEIGIKSNVTFFTRELYDYYINNKEVSLGYECKKHFVDNASELGYDIILDEITTVNHLAITRAGRGGSSVAIIDSIIGGLKPMRTGIFAWLKGKKQEDSSVATSFGQKVLASVKNSKGTTEEEIAGEMKSVLDSMYVLKDCETKSTLVNVVKDCFNNREKTLENEEELTKTLDSMWNEVHSCGLAEINNALGKASVKDSEEKEESKGEEKTKDSEKEKEKEESKEESKDSEKEESKGEEKTEDSEEKEESKGEEKTDSCNKDSSSIKDDILSAIKDSIKPLVADAVKEVLGIKENDKAEAKGCVVDNAVNGNEIRDYSSFL